MSACLSGFLRSKAHRPIVVSSILPPGVKTTEVPDDDPQLLALDPPLDSQVKKKAREIFVEEELARRRLVIHSVYLFRLLEINKFLPPT